MANKHFLINFARGHPDPDLLPHALIAMGANRLSKIVLPKTSNASSILNYSPGQGKQQYRKLLANFITRQSSDGCISQSRNLLTVNGVSHGLSLIAAVFAKPGDEVIMETPCYYLACDIFAHQHLKVVQLPAQPTSRFSVDTVEDILQAHPKARFLYLVPTNCNPSGNTLTNTERARLIEICRERNVIIIADEVYHFLDWKETSARPSRMVAFDPAYSQKNSQNTVSETEGSESDNGNSTEEEQEGKKKKRKTDQSRNDPTKVRESGGTDEEEEKIHQTTVISVSSFTKICSPGLRLGWIESSSAIIDKLMKHGYVRSGGGVAPLAESLVETLLQEEEEGGGGGGGRKKSPMEVHMAKLNTAYRNKAKILYESLTSEGFQIGFEPSGGYFIWVAIPEYCPLDAQELVEYAERVWHVSFLPGDRCQQQTKARLANADPLSRWMRLCFAMLNEEALVIGAQRLMKACRMAKSTQQHRD